jgi:membrane carboxypeptidase/penicillin-binding protein PbpC
MVRAFPIVISVLLVSTFLRSQDVDSDLAILPPMPNLYLGDPERELSFKMKRALAREEERKQRAAEAEKKELAQRMQTFRVTSEPEEKKTFFKKPIANRRSGPVTNSISSPDDALTADGTRLRPFGDDDYWGGINMIEETPLVELPPLPDLRTPDQVTSLERRRNKWATRQKVRSLTAEASRTKREQSRATTVQRPKSDPSLALVQVQSNQGAPASGIQDLPTTIDNSTLKPFNDSSTYYRDGFLMFRGDQKRQSGGGFKLFKKKSE